MERLPLIILIGSTFPRTMVRPDNPNQDCGRDIGILVDLRNFIAFAYCYIVILLQCLIMWVWAARRDLIFLFSKPQNSLSGNMSGSMEGEHATRVDLVDHDNNTCNIVSRDYENQNLHCQILWWKKVYFSLKVRILR